MKGTTALCGLAGTFVMLAIANLAAALVLPYWVKKGKNGVDTGLFIDCSVSDWPDDCEKFDVETILEHDLWLNIVRGLLCGALLLGLIAFLGYFCYCCCDCRKCILGMQFTCNLIAAGATIGGAVYYEKEIKQRDMETGISFSLSIGAATCFCAATVCSLFDLCRGEAGSA